MIADVDDNAPLRLSEAAALAFPHGGMTAAGLRREAARGRLAVSRIAGKDYTTLAAIRGMTEQCRVEPKAHGCGLARGKGPRRSMSHQRRQTSNKHRLRP
jgi:hypothetical protein